MFLHFYFRPSRKPKSLPQASRTPWLQILSTPWLLTSLPTPSHTEVATRPPNTVPIGSVTFALGFAYCFTRPCQLAASVAVNPVAFPPFHRVLVSYADSFRGPFLSHFSRQFRPTT